MPLHLLGHKSWNVYNSANIARVKADEEAAAAREAADEQRMQGLDAERRAAILRGRTPPPLPDEADKKDPERKRARADGGPERKRRKLAGEDDTDMDIRLAASMTVPGNDDENNAKVIKLRNTKIDAPLTDDAGHIDLFPVDTKEAAKREKNAEVEKEKRRKERAFEDQYTMRFSNAAGREGLENPWYAAQLKPTSQHAEDNTALAGLENKNVWGNEDPLRKQREHARITSNDPFAVMQQAQKQLKKSKNDKKKWAAERERELRELRATQEREDRRERHRKRKRADTHHVEVLRSDRPACDIDSDRSRRHRRPSSRDTSRRTSSHDRKRRRSRSRDRERHRHTSSRQDRHADDQRAQ